jgi:hypothetical protein
MAFYNVQNLNKGPEICISHGAQGGATTALVLHKRKMWAQQTAANSAVGFSSVTELAKLCSADGVQLAAGRVDITHTSSIISQILLTLTLCALRSALC